MNELNKLIGTAYVLGKTAEKDGLSSQDQKDELNALLLKLNEILATRPTCGKEQRLFLDEVEKKFTIDEDGDCVYADENAWSMIFHRQIKADLSKVIKGK